MDKAELFPYKHMSKGLRAYFDTLTEEFVRPGRQYCNPARTLRVDYPELIEWKFVTYRWREVQAMCLSPYGKRVQEALRQGKN